MILNDIWAQLNRLIQSSTTTDIDRKINALNIAQRYLIERMYFLGKRIDEFVTDPTNVANTIDTNYIVKPTDFLALHMAWYRSGTQYIKFGDSSFLTYDDFMSRVGQNFFSPGINGTPTILAVKEPNIYFDTFFNNVFTASETITGSTSGVTATVDSVSGTTLTYSTASGAFSSGEVITGSTSGTVATILGITATTMTIAITGGTKEIKISYVDFPDDIEYYDTITLTGIIGTFQVGETVEGMASNSTGIVRTVGTDNLTITNRDGTFQDTETIEGVTSLATGTMSGSITYLPQTLSWTQKYKFLLTEAAALIWEHMKKTNSVPSRSDIVDGLIEQLSVLNRGYEVSNWSTNN